jgi:hypothetical protein
MLRQLSPCPPFPSHVPTFYDLSSLLTTSDAMSRYLPQLVAFFARAVLAIVEHADQVLGSLSGHAYTDFSAYAVEQLDSRSLLRERQSGCYSPNIYCCWKPVQLSGAPENSTCAGAEKLRGITRGEPWHYCHKVDIASSTEHGNALA